MHILRFYQRCAWVFGALFLSPAIFAQQSQSPTQNCQWRDSFTAATVGATHANNSSNPVCRIFALEWTSTGFSALTIQLEGSDDGSSWTAFSGTTLVSPTVNPSSALSGSIVVNAIAKIAFIRSHVTAITGTGTISTQLFGVAGAGASLGNGGGGGSVVAVTATAPITSSGGTSPNISATYQGTSPTKIQGAVGASTVDHLLKYDATGNAVDSGITGLAGSGCAIAASGSSLTVTNSSTCTTSTQNQGDSPTVTCWDGPIVVTGGVNQVSGNQTLCVPANDGAGNFTVTYTSGTIQSVLFAGVGPVGPAGQGVPVGGTTGQILAKNSNTDYDTHWVNNTGGGGTVTSFSAGALSPLFTTSVATATTTPALSFTLSNFAADSIFGNFTGSSAVPSTQAIPACAADGSHALTYPSHTISCTALTASGNTTSTSLTTNAIPKANGANSIINSALSDDGTTVTSTLPISAPSIHLGPTFNASGGESSTPTTPSADTLFFSSTSHIPAYTKSGDSTIDATMVVPFSAVTHQFVTAINNAGVASQAQPAASDVSGLTAFATLATAGTGTYVRGDATTQTLNAAAVGLGNVTNDTQTKAAVMPNTTPSAGQIPAGNTGGTAYAPVTVSGDATLASTGALTVKGVNGVPLCTGFTPTNGQALEYTTTSSPNPCYTAATPGGGTVTDNIWIPVSAWYSTGAGAGVWPGGIGNPTSNAASNGTIFNGVTYALPSADFVHSTSNEQDLYVWNRLHDSWTGTVSIVLETFIGTASGNAYWVLSTACAPVGTVLNTLSYNAAQTVTTTYAASTNFQRVAVTFSNVTTTGCHAGDLLSLRVGRGGNVADTMTQDAFMLGLTLKVQHN